MILSVVYSNLSKVDFLDRIRQEHHNAMKHCEDTLNQLIPLMNNHSANSEMMKWFNLIDINKFGRVSGIIGQNSIENYKFDFSSFYNEEIDELIKFGTDYVFDYERAISYEKEIINALSSDIETDSSEERNLLFNFSNYTDVSNDLTKVKELADKIHEKIFKNLEITRDNRNLYSIFLASLVYSNLINDGNFEKPMDDLFKASVDYYITDAVPRDLTSIPFVIFSNLSFGVIVNNLQAFSKEEFAFKYEVLYTEKVEEKVFQEGWNKIILYDYYKKLSDDSKIISEKEDLPPDEKEKYKKLSHDYQKKADDALGKKY